MLFSLNKQKELCNYIGKNNNKSQEIITETLQQLISEGADINAYSPFPKHERDAPFDIAIKNSNINMINAVLSFSPTIINAGRSVNLSLDETAEHFNVVFNYIKNKLSIEQIKKDFQTTFNGEINVYTKLITEKKQRELDIIYNFLSVNDNIIEQRQVKDIIKFAVKNLEIPIIRHYLPYLSSSIYKADYNVIPFMFLDKRKKTQLYKLAEIISEDLIRRNDDAITLNIGKSCLEHIGKDFFHIFDDMCKKNNVPYKASQKIITLPFFINLINNKKTEQAIDLVLNGLPVTVNTKKLSQSIISESHLVFAWSSAQADNKTDLINEYYKIDEKLPLKNDFYLTNNGVENVVSMAIKLFIHKGHDSLLETILNNVQDFNFNKISPEEEVPLYFVSSIFFSDSYLDNIEKSAKILDKYITNSPHLNSQEVFFFFEYDLTIFNKIVDKHNINIEDLNYNYATQLLKCNVKSEYAISQRIKKLEKNLLTPYIKAELILKNIEQSMVNMPLNKHNKIKEVFLPLIEKACLDKIFTDKNTARPSIKRL